MIENMEKIGNRNRHDVTFISFTETTLRKIKIKDGTATTIFLERIIFRDPLS